MTTSKFPHQPQLPPEYKEHSIFKELESIATYYECLSFSSMGSISSGYDLQSITNIDVYIIGAIRGTIESTFLLLHNGNINDAYSIVRKYFDAVLFDTYQSVLREDYDHSNFDNFPHINRKLQEWYDKTTWMPNIEKQIYYLKQSTVLEKLMTFFDFTPKGKFGKIREELDNHIHMCGFLHLLKNDNQLYDNHRILSLEEIQNYIYALFTFHISSKFILNEQYLMASDFRDYIEQGLTPPEGSNLWISPWAQDAFNKFIKPNSELANYIKKTCSLEVE